VSRLNDKEPWLSGEVNEIESYFGGSCKGKRGRGSVDKVPIFEFLQCNRMVPVVIIPNTKQNTLTPILRQTIKTDSIVYIDSFLTNEAQDVCKFGHRCINQSEKFLKKRNYIDGTKNFLNQGYDYSCLFNDFSREHFYLFIKECERPFNYRPTSRLSRTL
jgi:transposase